jgi:hypothetical protein
MSRKTETRKQKVPAITLIGEGITEQYYFKHIKSFYGYHYTLKPYFFGTTSLQDMDRKIAEVLEGRGIAICVFDTDVSRRDVAERRKLSSRLAFPYFRTRSSYTNKAAQIHEQPYFL